jgi:ABC-type sugar transport system ATPase subunit
MSVFENMSYGLKIQRVPNDEIRRRVEAAAEILEITSLLDRQPRHISGGQRQRVAMGRAIVREPAVFLFDEPLSNLDAKLRVQMRLEIKKLQERLGITSIYVTHDQVEAMTLADKIVVLRGGNIEQIGTPIDLYENPRNMFVAEFIGSPSMNFFNDTDLTEAGHSMLKSGADVFGVRPEHFSVVDEAHAILSARPDFVENLGEYALIYCKTQSGSEFIVKSNELHKFTKGELVHLGVDAEKTYSFDGATQLRL